MFSEHKLHYIFPEIRFFGTNIRQMFVHSHIVWHGYDMSLKKNYTSIYSKRLNFGI